MKQANFKQKRRKGIRIKQLLLLVVISAMSLTIQAQVTIGLGEQPVPGALLQLKDKENVSDGTFNAHKGLALPRVALSEKKELYPMFLADPDNPASGPNSDYATNKLILDKTHTGLIVYNLVEDDEKELCLGLNQWDGEQWNCFQQKIGNAIGHIIACDDIKIFGHYKSPDLHPLTPPSSNVIPLDASNYITVKLEITKPGAYSINITPAYAGDLSKTNGYFFIASGMFMEKGIYTVTIPGSGTPFWYTPTGNPGDELAITMNGKALTLENGTTCTKNIIVEDYSKKPNYTMDCGRTTVHGVYALNQALNPASNYISVWITIDPSDPFVEGSTVYIETDKVDGISFASVPALITAADKAAGEKEIILKGTGKPTTVDTKRMTITSNSATNVATCYANVSIAFPVKKTYGWGYYDNTAGYIMQPSQGTGKLINANVNFGTDENSTVKVVKYSPTQTFNYSSLSGASAYSNTSVKAMFDQKPEIVLTGFDLDVTNKSTVAGYMVDYLKQGGVLVLVLERSTMAEAFFQALYPGITVSGSGLISASRLQFGFFNDEILNGPFGDIRGKFYGNDAGGTISITGLPEEDIIVYARDSNGKPTMFQHKFYNLIFIGDGGIFANYDGNTGSTSGTATTYPLTIDSNFRPITKTSWSGGDVENARLFANVMAWAVKTAQFKGIYAPK
ncbi:MAG: hypothetical protein LBQ74_21000 [Prevotella sp.]|jgi:hypothetical protein|nr:hypothetical protein [Prevotella sp.]